ncbi:hypothetical protein QAD02_011486, partial [Eretmocerus hayati]
GITMDAAVQSESENVTTYRDITQFCYAISEHNERALLELLRRGYDVNATIPPGNPFERFSKKITGLSALHYACQVESEGSIGVLLDNGADFTLKNSSGLTALHYLAQRACELPSKTTEYVLKTESISSQILSAHVKYHVTTNPVNNHGLSHLHIACLKSHLASVKLFLVSSAQINEPIHKDSPILPGFTALHIACRYASLEVVELLMENGTDVHARNKDGLVPLQLIPPRVEELSFLALDRDEFQDDRELYCKLEVDTYGIAPILIQKTIDSETLINQLCIACAKKCIASIHEIIDKGLDINAQTDHGLTALHCAALVDFNVTKLLVERGGDLFSKTTDGITCLDICTWKYGYDTLRLLPFDQRIGKYVIQDGPSWQIAESLQNKTTLKNLLSDDDVAREINTACIASDSPVWPGATPLHLAIIFARKTPFKCKGSDAYDRSNPKNARDLVETLIFHGASMTVKDAKGQTPVHTAFFSKQFGILKMLLDIYDRSLDIRHLISVENAEDKTGLSHLHIACIMGYRDGILLLTRGSSFNKPLKSSVSFSLDSSEPEMLLKSGSTPLHIAAKLKRIGVIKLLACLNADICARDADGSTPIDLIVSNVDFDESELVEIAFLLIYKYCISDSNSESGRVEVSHFRPLGAILDPILFHARHGYGNRHSISRLLQHLDSSGIDENMEFDKLKKVFECLDELFEVVTNGLDSSALVARYTNSLKKMLEKRSKYKLSVRQCFESYSQFMLDHYKCLPSTLLDEESGLTYLHLASAIHMKDGAEMAMKLGCDVNCRLSSESPFFPGSTPLHLAIWGSRKKTSEDYEDGFIEFLLDHGADPTIQDVNGETPLHLADRYSLIQIREFLLHDPSVTQKNLVSKHGRSHFHIACKSTSPEVVETFLEHGADPNELCYVVDDNVWNVLPAEDVPFYFGFTPFHTAYRLEVIEVLLKHGADPKIGDYQGWTALHQAARHGFGADVIETLIRKGGADVNARSVLHLTALDLIVTEKVVHYGGISHLRALLEHGALVNRENFEDSSTLARAFESYDVENFQALVKYGTDLGNLNENKRTALHELFLGHLNDTDEYIMIIEQFCERGIDIDCQDSSKRTPLHTAVINGLDDGIIALLACGADVNMIDCNKCTPFSTLMANIDDIDLEELSSDLKQRISMMARHVRKMQAFNLKVVQQNALLESKCTEICDEESSDNDAERLQLDELKKMKEIVLKENLTLHDVMYMENCQLVGHEVIDQLKSVLSSDDFHTKFPELGGILKLKLRIAQRKKAISLARKSLFLIFRMKIPDACTEIIACCLSNTDLETVVDMMVE